MTPNAIRRLLTVACACLALAACSTSTDTAGPTTSSTPATTSSAVAPADCQVNPADAPAPTAEPYEPVPADSRIAMSLKGIPSGTVQPGAAPVEVEVTLCNDSPVAYPKVGVVLVLEHCNCTDNPARIPEGTVERFDEATQAWIKLDHPAAGTGMDYLAGYENVQDLPKSKTVTLRYRVALNASMHDGQGGLEAIAVVPDPLVQIGRANLPFAVAKKEGAPATPNPRESLVPLHGVTYPSHLVIDAAGDVYVTDMSSVLKLAAGSHDQSAVFPGPKVSGGIAVDKDGNLYVTLTEDKKVLKLAAGSSEETELPFTGLQNPQHLAVDPSGNVYVSDGTKVVKLAAGSNEQTVLPLTDLKWIRALAVDGAGDLYVNDGANNKLVVLTAGSSEPTVLPLPEDVDGLAVDAAGDLYVVDGINRKVLKSTAGGQDWTPLALTGLNSPQDVAVDASGDVYVLDDNGFGQLVKLAAG